MVDLSIIVPLYIGGKYIQNIIQMVKKCHCEIYNINIELIFVNDYPDEKISISNKVEDFEIVLLSNKTNIGIHKTRIEGLKAAQGNYILFLDQDDYIFPDYIKKQFDCIGDADAVVCRLLNGSVQHYTDSFIFEKVVTKEFMLNNWCSIVSPGQVILKKTSIPDLWKTYALNVSGADDYFLWLLMWGYGRKVALNNEILFEHKITGINTSLNTNMMMDSEQEMVNVLINNNIFNDEDETALKKLCEKLRKIHIKQLDNANYSYLIYKNLININQDIIRHKLYGKTAIYGAGEIGKAFYDCIKDCGIDLCFIDRNEKYINSDIPIYTLKKAPKDIDIVIVAVNGELHVIKENIEIELPKSKTISIKQFLDEIIVN
ncbi:MAG: glycosyltransferase family 2 protein [Lachnospiraceae bacterium]|nr:glycosyltransferase family 2 protein [Lachnospiraceae bacterium]